MNALAVHHDVDRENTIAIWKAFKANATFHDFLAGNDFPHRGPSEFYKSFCHI
jgi:hypothetical protein